MGQGRVSTYAGDRYWVPEDEADDNGPRVACPFCDALIPLRRAIGPTGRKPLNCPRCEREVSLPGVPTDFLGGPAVLFAVRDTGPAE